MPELASYRLSRQDHSKHSSGFSATDVYSIPHNLLDELEPQYRPNAGNYWHGRPAASSSGLVYYHWASWPQITSYQLQKYDPKMPGHALLTCHYSTPDDDDIIIADAQKGDEYGYIQIIGSSQLTPAAYDYDGEPVNVSGCDSSGDSAIYYKWAASGGSDLMPDPTVMMVLTVAYRGDRVSLGSVRSKIGKINAGRMDNFVYAAARTLRLQDINLERSFRANDIWLVRLAFLYHPQGWDNACKATRYIQTVRQVYQDGDTSKPPVKIAGWEEDSANVNQPRKMHRGEEDFSEWNLKVRWTRG